MKDQKHTPGEWIEDRNHILDENGNVIATVCRDQDGHVKANAHLIAGAPELLEVALCSLADFEGIMPKYDDERTHPAWETINELKKAIAKATEGA